MTYTVSSGTLNPTQLNSNHWSATNVDWLIVKWPRDHGDRPWRRTELTVKHGVLSLSNMRAQRRTTDLWRHYTTYFNSAAAAAAASTARINLPSRNTHLLLITGRPNTNKTDWLYSNNAWSKSSINIIIITIVIFTDISRWINKFMQLQLLLNNICHSIYVYNILTSLNWQWIVGLMYHITEYPACKQYRFSSLLRFPLSFWLIN